MIPIFSSLEMMKQALEVNQEVIQTTGNNISNANTAGYSRQRVDLAESLSYPGIGLNAPKINGAIGTGVSAQAVTRVRDQFADQQVRDNTNLNGYWSALSDAYSQMEDIVNETTATSSDLTQTEGISTALNNFWQSLEDLSSNSDTSGTGSTVLEDGAALADTLNYTSTALSKVQANLSSQISENVTLVNSYSDQINTLNQQINQQEANGNLPNDLYDQRDQLVDKLSQLVNVKVTVSKSGGNPPALAEGLYTVNIVDANGNAYSPAATLVDGTTLTNNHLSVTTGTGSDGYPTAAESLVSSDGTQTVTSAMTNGLGELQGEIDAYTTDFPEVMKSLDHFSSALSTEFNSAYAASAGGTSAAESFFLGSGSGSSPGTVTAANIHVNSDLTDDDITSNTNGQASGDNSAATAMAAVVESNKYDVDAIAEGGTPTASNEVTLLTYIAGLIGQIGTNSQTAQNLETNSATMLTSAQNHQTSVSGVSTDEELTNLIQYQQSYAACAKVVTTLDTMLDTLISKMGA